MLALGMNSSAAQSEPQQVTASTSPAAASPIHKRPVYQTTSSSEMITMLPQAATNKRPKLSLQTSALPMTFGKSSTAFSIPASATATSSPTRLNTYNNAYDIPHRPSPSTSSPSGARLPRPSSRLVSPYPSIKEDLPYKLPRGVKSILRNTPIPSSLRRCPSICNSASPRNGGRKVFFPPVKRVAYRYPLEEEVKTSKFVIRHSDISSDDESDFEKDLSVASDSENEEESTESLTTGEERGANGDKGSSSKKTKRYSNRQVQAVALREGINTEEYQGTVPKTPSSRKRRRKWEWTLAPFPVQSEEAPQSPKQASGESAARISEPVVEAKPLAQSCSALPEAITTTSVPEAPRPMRPALFLPRLSEIISSQQAEEHEPILINPAQIPLPDSATSPHKDSSPATV